MYRQQAKSGWHVIDEKMIKTDSLMEASIIKHLVENGFSGKWLRRRGGLAFGYSSYTPDVELCVLHDSMNRRALIEFKAFSVGEFTSKDRNRMLAASKIYGDALCMLYVYKTNQWYIVEPHGTLTKTTQPTPGGILFNQLPKPKFLIPVFNRYGRRYWTRPHVYMAKKTADGLEFVVKTFFYSPREKRRRRK